jgi:glycosyltransferase involved in cell wall biosynthesis
MRILIVTKRYYTNSDLVGRRYGRLYHLPEILAGRGHEVCVLALDYKTFEGIELEEGRLRMLSVPSRSRGLFLSKGNLEGLLDGSRPVDAVIGSGHLHIASLAKRLASRLRAAFVFEAYDYYPAFLPFPARGPGALWFRNLCRAADGCVAASQRTAALMSKSNRRVCIVENGFDPATFKTLPAAESRRHLGLDQGTRYVSCIGSATEALGFGDFLSALETVRSVMPDVMGLHAGSLATRYRGAAGVKYLGQTSQENVVRALAASSCGLVPYRDSLQVQYSNSCKLVEYMATGIPIVATRTGDNERVLGPGYPGLCAPANPDELAAAILRQLRAPVPAGYPGEWKWERLGGRLDEFLRSVCRG